MEIKKFNRRKLLKSLSVFASGGLAGLLSGSENINTIEKQEMSKRVFDSLESLSKAAKECSVGTYLELFGVGGFSIVDNSIGGILKSCGVDRYLKPEAAFVDLFGGVSNGDVTSAIDECVAFANAMGNNEYVRFGRGIYHTKGNEYLNALPVGLGSAATILKGVKEHDSSVIRITRDLVLPGQERPWAGGWVYRTTGAGGFSIEGDGESTREGIVLKKCISTSWRDISIYKTLGSCISMRSPIKKRVPNHNNVFNDFVLNNPIDAEENDVPMIDLYGVVNGNRFLNLTLCNRLSKSAVAHSGAVRVVGERDYTGLSPINNVFRDTLLENLYIRGGSKNKYNSVFRFENSANSIVDNIYNYDLKNIDGRDLNCIVLATGAERGGGVLVQGQLPSATPAGVRYAVVFENNGNAVLGKSGTNGDAVLIRNGSTENDVILVGRSPLFDRTHRSYVVDKNKNNLNSIFSTRDNLRNK